MADGLSRNIAAHTPPGSHYPPYISINETPNGSVTIAVRSPADGDNEGALGTIELDQDAWSEIKRQIAEA